MTSAKELLDAATPLPWSRGMFTVPDGPGWDSDAALIVYAVNHLPDYEAAVEALERMLAAADTGTRLWMQRILDEENADLRRLRDEVPA
jgi:hypothetical protein